MGKTRVDLFFGERQVNLPRILLFAFKVLLKNILNFSSYKGLNIKDIVMSIERGIYELLRLPRSALKRTY